MPYDVRWNETPILTRDSKREADTAMKELKKRREADVDAKLPGAEKELRAAHVGVFDVAEQKPTDPAPPLRATPLDDV